MTKTITMAVIAVATILFANASTAFGGLPDNGTPNNGTPGNGTSNNGLSNNGLPCNTSSTNRGTFLTVDGMNGLDGKQCVFEIKSFSFGVENPTTIGSATGGAGAGKAKFSEFTITKTTDSASPLFFRSTTTGSHFKTVTLEMRKAGGDPNSSGKPFLIYQFKTVFTTKVDWSGSGDEGPTESITFEYGQLSVEYHQQKSDLQPVVHCWDVVTNTICQ